MLGMGALSAVIAVPLVASARWLAWANRVLQGAVSLITVAIGINTIVATLSSSRARPFPDRRRLLCKRALALPAD